MDEAALRRARAVWKIGKKLSFRGTEPDTIAAPRAEKRCNCTVFSVAIQLPVLEDGGTADTRVLN